MRAFVLSAGAGLGNEQRFKDRLQKVIEQVVDNAVAERGGKDLSDDRLCHHEMDGFSRQISAIG